jgi:hypothetical protein
MNDEDGRCDECGAVHIGPCIERQSFLAGLEPKAKVLQPDNTIKPDRTCRECGCPLKFIELDGKTIPLDLRAPVYQVVNEFGEEDIARARYSFVSHFSTCPKAGSFSRKGARTTEKST